MSRQSVENRLNQLKENEKAHFWQASLWTPTAVLGITAAAENISGQRPTDIFLSAAAGVLAVRSVLKGLSESRSAAVIEGVLAQDDLYRPDPEPETQAESASLASESDATSPDVLNDGGSVN
ncbi:MAG: hypothetical protein WDN66_03705 [Candidatus Saccharibacteria bacterium]